MDLSFKVLDDLCLGIERGRVTPDILSSLVVSSITPVVEAWHQSHIFDANGLPFDWASTPLTEQLLADFVSKRSRSQMHGSKIGWIIGQELFETETSWVGFVMRAKKAASNAGFDRKATNGVTGALDEFRSNISEHSNNAKTGYAAFYGDKGIFEFVIGDFGIGALNSLKTNPLHADLSDHGEALSLALTEGVSRHGDVSRGNGFRPLLVGLANISGFSRFRSGDHSYEIKRTTNGELETNVTQRVYLTGFSCAVQFST